MLASGVLPQRTVQAVAAAVQSQAASTLLATCPLACLFGAHALVNVVMFNYDVQSFALRRGCSETKMRDDAALGNFHINFHIIYGTGHGMSQNHVVLWLRKYVGVGRWVLVAVSAQKKKPRVTTSISVLSCSRASSALGLLCTPFCR